MSIELIADVTYPLHLEEELTGLVKTLVVFSRKENGCERYDAFIKENGIVIVEAWTKQTMLDLHQTKQHFLNLVAFIEKHNLVITITPVSSLL